MPDPSAMPGFVDLVDLANLVNLVKVLMVVDSALLAVAVAVLAVMAESVSDMSSRGFDIHLDELPRKSVGSFLSWVSRVISGKGGDPSPGPGQANQRRGQP